METVKLTVNITKEALETLKALAGRNNTTMTNIVNKAIASEKFFAAEIDAGSEIQLHQRDGKTKTVIFR